MKVSKQHLVVPQHCAFLCLRFLDFDHQVRDVIYHALPVALAQQYHAVIGEKLEERLAGDGKEVSGPDAVQLYAATGAGMFRVRVADAGRG